MSAGCAQDERIESDIPAADSDWRSMRFPVTSAGSQTVAGRTDILFLHHEESLLEWGVSHTFHVASWASGAMCTWLRALSPTQTPQGGG